MSLSRGKRCGVLLARRFAGVVMFRKLLGAYVGLVAGISGLMFAASETGATLINRGGGLIYDDVLNITWLQDANYSQTTGFSAEGLMTWDNAMVWATDLSYFDTVRDVTWSDWRLPTMSPVDGSNVFNTTFSNNAVTDAGTADSAGWVDGFGNPTSEMGHLYYVSLGNLGACIPNGSGTSFGCDPSGFTTPSNTGPFSNLQIRTRYWTGVEVAPNSAWDFDFGGGVQNTRSNSKDGSLFAWAVRDGNVFDSDPDPTPIPEPSTLALFATGLAGLGFVSWRRRKRVQLKAA